MKIGKTVLATMKETKETLCILRSSGLKVTQKYQLEFLLSVNREHLKNDKGAMNRVHLCLKYRLWCHTDFYEQIEAWFSLGKRSLYN